MHEWRRRHETQRRQETKQPHRHRTYNGAGAIAVGFGHDDRVRVEDPVAKPSSGNLSADMIGLIKMPFFWMER